MPRALATPDSIGTIVALDNHRKVGLEGDPTTPSTRKTDITITSQMLYGHLPAVFAVMWWMCVEYKPTTPKTRAKALKITPHVDSSPSNTPSSVDGMK